MKYVVKRTLFNDCSCVFGCLVVPVSACLDVLVSLDNLQVSGVMPCGKVLVFQT